MAVIGAMWAIIFAAGSWWVSRVEEHLKVVDQLQFRAYYLHGQIAEAPVQLPQVTPSPLPVAVPPPH
jgi:hypothetical protein